MIAPTLAEWDGEPVAVLRERWDVPRLEAYATIGSTNDRAAQLAREGAEPYTVVVADEQSAGRGRRGRSWVSAPGSGLLMSVVLPPIGPGGPGPLPLVIGLAAAEAIERLAPGVEVRVKWPNDLWIGGRKVGGILCEGRVGHTVAGVGINVRASPEGRDASLVDTATSIENERGKVLSRNRLAHAVLSHVEGLLRANEGRMSASTRAELSRRDALAGAPLTTEAAGDGVGAGIAPDGALLLGRPDGSTVRVVAGSVRLR